MKALAPLAMIAAVSMAMPAMAQTASNPAAPDADARADALVKAMTLDEKIQLVFGQYATPDTKKGYVPPVEVIPYSAGFVAGIPRLNIPNQSETDAGVGVASHRTAPTDQRRQRIALPSGLATAATWNRDTAFAGGAMIGHEARLSGFNVQLAGGINLLREPRNGRNFEYGGEDPLLAGTLVGQQIRGIQSNAIVATIKHFALNDQETHRFTVNSIISDQAARQSDLLAFQIAIETGDPGAVMCSYNRVNGVYACENDGLLNGVLKGDWGFKGYVMSDWGADHSTVAAAINGLDQESGWVFDKSPYFNGALKEAVVDGYVPQARLDDMVHRILRSLIKHGTFDNPVSRQDAQIDLVADAAISQNDAEQAIVLLKNTGTLPLAKSAKTIAIIGGHADVGVLSGGGSSQVYAAANLTVPNEGPDGFPGPMVWYPSSPLKALAAGTQARITYSDGKDIKAAARLAAQSDIVIVFAAQWTGESLDASLTLPGNQDALIDAVANANHKTVVVLETGGPVLMPWLNKTSAVLEAWYPGTSGGEAIARVLTGEVNPSGHLPVTFPASLDQLPRPVLDPALADPDAIPVADYNIEGAAVGYKWYDLKGLKPLFPFGHGLSYTTFAQGGLTAKAEGGTIRARFTVSNTGKVAGMTVPQIYVSGPGFEAPKRLGGWDKIMLKPGETKTVELSADPRLLGVYDSPSKTWKIADGDITVSLAASAATVYATAKVHLAARTLNVRGQ